MTALLFFKSLLAGFILSMPLGPVNFLCIRNTLLHGKYSGLFSGLGAATADSIYAFIAVMGLSIITDFIAMESEWLRIVSGLIVVLVGLNTFRSRPECTAAPVTGQTLYSHYLKSLGLTLANPISLLALLSVMTMLHIAAGGIFSIILITAGFFLGAALWWCILIAFIHQIQSRMNDTLLQQINRSSGIVIILIGLFAACGRY